MKKKYGIWIDEGQDMASTLSIQSEDEALYDHEFKLTIESSVREEPTWYNTTDVTIYYEKPLQTDTK